MKVLNELWEFIVKNIVLLIFLFASAAVKIMVENRIKKLKWWQNGIKYFISVFCGAWAAKYLIDKGMYNTAIWLCPIATLLGEGFIIWCLLHSNNLYAFAVKRIFGAKDSDIDGKNN